MRLDLSKTTRLFALAIFAGALSLPALIVSYSEAKAGWCVSLGSGTNRCYKTLKQCQIGTPGRNCVRGRS